VLPFPSSLLRSYTLSNLSLSLLLYFFCNRCRNHHHHGRFLLNRFFVPVPVPVCRLVLQAQQAPILERLYQNRPRFFAVYIYIYIYITGQKPVCTVNFRRLPVFWFIWALYSGIGHPGDSGTLSQSLRALYVHTVHINLFRG